MIQLQPQACTVCIPSPSLPIAPNQQMPERLHAASAAHTPCPQACLPCSPLQPPCCNVQAQRGLTGIMNYTNPGAVSHNEVLQMYKDYIDPDFTWSNFTVEEQAKVIVAPRSNNLLDTKRVRAIGALHVPAAVRAQQVFATYAARCLGRPAGTALPF